MIPSSPEAKELRFELASAWRGLSVVALAPIVLLSPLPYLLPFGMPIAVAAGFAPVFRLVSLRRFDAVPEALAPVASPPVGSLRALQIAELGFVAIVAVFAIGGTLGAIPATLVSAYYGTVFVWWLVAMTTVSVQLRGGHAIAAQLVDPAILPSVERPVRCAMLARIAGATGVLVGLGASTVCSGTSAAGPLGTFGLLLVIAAAGLGFYACLLAYGHATVVAECMIESDLLRERGATERDGADADPLDPSTPPPASPGTWEDEERVPLA